MIKKVLVEYEQSESAIKNKIKPPSRGHESDSGWDIFMPENLVLPPQSRITISLEVKFALLPISIPISEFVHLSMEAQIRPKSGLSKSGLDVELGTIDNGYRNFVGATVSNTTMKKMVIQQNTKICQIVFVPIFTNVALIPTTIDSDTDRGENGFGSTGLE